MTTAPAGVQLALKSLSTQLSGAQVGITVTNLAVGFLAEPAIAEPGRRAARGRRGARRRGRSPIALGIGLALGTVLTMLFGEMVPKNVALAMPLETARPRRASCAGSRP